MSSNFDDEGRNQLTESNVQSYDQISAPLNLSAVDEDKTEHVEVSNTLQEALCEPGKSNTCQESSETDPINISLGNTSEAAAVENVVNTSNSFDSSDKEQINDFKTEKDIEITNKIDETQVLNNFKNKKSKVTLPLKLNESDLISDAKLVKMHKETITQDLGNIVKNVHGLFSSVSGTLKNAYKTSPQNIANVNKFITNGSKSHANIQNIDENKSAEIQSRETSAHNSESSNNDQILTVEISEEKVDVFKKQMSDLELEVALLRERVKQQNDQIIEKDRINKELENKNETYKKRSEVAEREMNSAVMKYATSERVILEARAEAEKAKKSEKAALTEMNLMNGKLKSAFSEKQRICQMYDNKCHDLSLSEKELSKLKEDLTQIDNKLKWTQGRLKAELDNYKESSSQIEKLTLRLNELETNKEANVVATNELHKAKQLEKELKECQAALILSKHESSEAQVKLVKISSELEECTDTLAQKTSRVQELEVEVDKLKKSNIHLEEEAAELAALRARAALADTLATNLERESLRVTSLEGEVARERSRASAAAARESRSLQQATELLDKHSALATQLSEAINKSKALAADNASLRERVLILETELTSTREKLTRESTLRRDECHLLAKKVAELTNELSESKKQLEYEKGENGVLKKKHASALKELNRELQRALKRCEQLEAKVTASDGQDLTPTRTGSLSSLSSAECTTQVHSERVPVNGHQSSGSATHEDLTQIPDTQTLIERIVQLQRASARRSERIDFLEEHNKQLTHELRKKSKLLKHLTANLPAGALAEQSRDDNKKEMARLGGGAMAALWGGQNDGLTLELSLEMNKKLQAVLEDTLLKNITLKDNMETLGAEIERLKKSTQKSELGKT